MMAQGTGQRRKYDGAGDRSLFGLTNMVAQGTGQPQIWWCRGQVSHKEQNMVVQGTGQSGNMMVQGTGQNSKVSLFKGFQHFWPLSLSSSSHKN